MEFDFINDTTATAYFHTGLGNFVGTYNGGTIDANTSFAIAPGGTVTGLDITSVTGGKLLLSLGTVLPNDNPTFQNNSGGDDGWEIRWDKVELSLIPGQVSSINLTSTDFYGLDLQVQTFATSTTMVPAATLSWQQGADQLFPTLAGFANNGTDVAVPGPPGSDGVNVPGVGSNVLRVIAPSTIPPASAAPLIADMQDYINNVETAGIVTNIQDVYSNSSTVGPPSMLTQHLTFTATVPSSGAMAGDLVMVGSGDEIGANQTIDIPDAAAGIISVNPTFYVNGTADTFANNDAYGVVVRDILAGFNAGLVGSSAINPNSGTADLTYAQSIDGFPNGDTANAYWFPVPIGFGFAQAQPGNPGFYNQFAALISQHSDSYGFPFTDVLAAPLASLNNVDHVDITILPDNIPCFVAGTRIATPYGELAIEHLRVGDEVTTVSGEAARIRWIGSRQVDCRRHADPEQVRPIHISPDAFGVDRPRRALLLSPDHAVFVDGYLIPIKLLANGTTITQPRPARVTYYHIELARHDVVLAEGMPAETFLETGNRAAFENAGGVMQLHPNFAPQPGAASLIWESTGYAPLITEGSEIDRVRGNLARQAAMLLATARRLGTGD
jgi:hypothetical protein